MATRWQIGVIDSTGDIVSTYVHYDGSPMQVKGKVKDMTYNQVMELLDNGKNGYSTLTKPYEADEHKSSWVEGHTDDLAAYMTKVKQSWSDYVYLFDEDEQQWMYAKTGQRELMPLFHIGFTEGQRMTFKDFLEEGKLKNAHLNDDSPLGQLKRLPQPIGINGGSYTYWVDVTKTPLKFVASDGSQIDKAKTLEDIAGWLDKYQATQWLAFLKGDSDADDLVADGVLRQKKGSTDQRDHEARMRD